MSEEKKREPRPEAKLLGQILRGREKSEGSTGAK